MRARPTITVGMIAKGDCGVILSSYHTHRGARGGVVVKALSYKPAGRGFDSRCCHWNFSVT